MGPCGLRMSWTSVVWFSGRVLKWAFICWLCFLEKLETKDRLSTWGIKVDANCVLCAQAPESHQNLFFFLWVW